MVFGYMEYGEMRVYKNLDDAIQEWRKYPIDVLSEVVIFYTDSGMYLKPTPVYLKRKWYQLKPSIGHLTFEETLPAEGNVDTFGYLVHCETTEIHNNEFIESMDSLKDQIQYES